MAPCNRCLIRSRESGLQYHQDLFWQNRGNVVEHGELDFIEVRNVGKKSARRQPSCDNGASFLAVIASLAPIRRATTVSPVAALAVE